MGTRVLNLVSSSCRPLVRFLRPSTFPFFLAAPDIPQLDKLLGLAALVSHAVDRHKRVGMILSQPIFDILWSLVARCAYNNGASIFLVLDQAVPKRLFHLVSFSNISLVVVLDADVDGWSADHVHESDS